MPQINENSIVKVITRMPFNLKKRLLKAKYRMQVDRDSKVTNDEIVCSALDSHLKKFER
jgi:transcriptional regulator of met regulon